MEYQKKIKLMNSNSFAGSVGETSYLFDGALESQLKFNSNQIDDIKH